MSGFAGIIGRRGEPCNPALLRHWAEKLEYRGPDGTFVHAEPGAAFCFTFLKTGPAPQRAKQPFSLDGRFWFLGEARLDGRDELIRRLCAAGEDASPQTSDEELILQTWRAWGREGIEGLEGDLAYALWDREARRLICARDLIGPRSFYYAVHEGRFYFSNELRRILEVPGISRELDPVFIGDFLLQEFCGDAERTAYRDLRRLPPGHILTYDDGQLSVRPYAQLPIEEPIYLKRSEEYIEQFRALLEQAVRERLPHEPTVIFLSGGLDSTSIGAVAVDCARKDGREPEFHAFTADCRPLFDDEESDFARLAANHLGIPIEIVSRGWSPPFDQWELPALQTVEPHNDIFFEHNLRLYGQTVGSGRVALLGYGGDDILTGQSWPYLLYLLRRGRLGEILKSYGAYTIRHGRVPPPRGGFRTRLRRWFGIRNGLTEFPDWLNPDFVERQKLRERWGKLNQNPNVHPIHPLGYGNPFSHFYANVFEVEDASWTGAVLEARAPLLDLRLMRFLLRLPPVPWCTEKEILRQAMRERLPEAIRVRPKTPLSGDPMAIHLARGTWSPERTPLRSSQLPEFVDRQKLQATFFRVQGSFLEVATRALSLDRWLKTIENAPSNSLQSVPDYEHQNAG